MILYEDIREIISDKNIQWEKLKNSNIFVTGATGLIGSLCIRCLLELNFPLHVSALVRDSKEAKKIFGERISYIESDVRDVIPGIVSPDYIIHCASNTKSKMMIESPVETIDVSVTGTMKILQLAISSHVKSIIYISSMEAYGIIDKSQNPVTEEKLGYIDLTTARASYSEGKRMSECICSAYFHQYCLPVKIVRLALTFGAGMPLADNRVSMQFANSVVNGKNIILHTTGNSLSNFCYTSDCIRGIFTVLLNGQNGQIYNICNDKETRSIREIAEIIVEKIARNSIKIIFDIPKDNRFGYAPDTSLWLSSEKLMNIGWHPQISLEDAYKRLIQYIQETK